MTTGGRRETVGGWRDICGVEVKSRQPTSRCSVFGMEHVRTFVCGVSFADQPRWGGGSSFPAALHIQTGADRRGRQSGETLELLRLPGNQEHIGSAGHKDTVALPDRQDRRRWRRSKEGMTQRLRDSASDGDAGAGMWPSPYERELSASLSAKYFSTLTTLWELQKVPSVTGLVCNYHRRGQLTGAVWAGTIGGRGGYQGLTEHFKPPETFGLHPVSFLLFLVCNIDPEWIYFFICEGCSELHRILL